MEEKIEEDLRKELDNIYTPLEEAKAEIWRRWNDKELRKKVEAFLEGDVPEFLKDEPKSVLVRQITSADEEFFLFLKMSKAIGLNPLFVEFHDDKFVSCNPDKYYRCNMYIHEGKGRNGGYKIKSKKIVDVDFFDGKKIKDVKTVWGESLLEFHHKIIETLCPSTIDKIVDVSKWIENNGKIAKFFYLNYLSWFICHGILFENFSINKETEFTKNIVLPTIKKIEQKFKLKPLIVSTIPIDDQDNIYWWYYPKKVGDLIDSLKVK